MRRMALKHTTCGRRLALSQICCQSQVQKKEVNGGDRQQEQVETQSPDGVGLEQPMKQKHDLALLFIMIMIPANIIWNKIQNQVEFMIRGWRQLVQFCSKQNVLHVCHVSCVACLVSHCIAWAGCIPLKILVGVQHAYAEFVEGVCFCSCWT